MFMFSAGKSLALPECEGSPTESFSTVSSWTDCFGILTFSSGKHEGTNTSVNLRTAKSTDRASTTMQTVE